MPLPLIEPLLVQAVHTDRQTGLVYIEEVAATWRQAGAAQLALQQLAAIQLQERKSERTLAEAIDALRWLPQTLPPTVAATLGRFRTVSQLMEEKLVLVDSEAQLRKLSTARAELDDLIQGLTFVPARERQLFLPIAHAWRDVLQKAGNRLPNPYVAGNPLWGDTPGLFVGRQDLLQSLQAQLLNRTQRPALLLYGQRRMGKSSLLYQLPQELEDTVIPIHVDGQAGEMQESNAAFLYNLGRTIYSQAHEQRQLKLPAPPSLAETTFTTFSEWLDAAELQLGTRTMLLALDEFEAVDAAIAQGWLDARLLGFLRNLIQHHPKIDLLLAGSHHPRELTQDWSSYLISVNVLEISYLDERSTRHLIEAPIPGFGLHYEPAAVDEIIRLTRCQPLLVQLLCQELVHLLNERGEHKATVADIEAAIPRAFSSGSSLYFDYLQKDAGAVGDTILRNLAQAEPSASVPRAQLTGGQNEYEQALKKLLQRDLVEEVDGGISFEVELVRRWWASQR